MTQPLPKPGGVEVAPLVISDIHDRIAQGQRTYGQPLLTGDGRDSLWDAYEEALDLAIYLRKAILERDQAKSA